MKAKIAFFMVLTGLFSVPAFAGEIAESQESERAIFDKEGNPMPDNQVNSADVDWEILKNADGKNDRWKSAGQIVPGDGKGSCSITLVEPPGGCTLNPARKALALTNGHCVGLMKTRDPIVRDQAYSQAVSFNHFIDTQGAQVRANIQKTVYGTMQGSDLALVELDMSYAELARKGIKPKKIAQSFDGSQLTNVATPANGVEKDKQFLRKASCDSRGKVAVSEGGFFWPNQIRLNCSVVGGSSGGGLFKEASDELMGLMNTGVPYGEQGFACRMNRPCEVNGAQQSVNVTNYGFDVTFLHKCADQQCAFKPELEGCPLAATAGPQVDLKNAINEKTEPANLDANPDSRFQAYQVKWGIAGSTDCAKSDGYKDAGGKTFQPPLSERAPDGVYVLCVRGQFKDGTWQDYKDATMKTAVIDRKKPIAVLRPLHGGYTVASDDPLDAVNGFMMKVVTKREDCQKERGYKAPGVHDFRVIRPRETSGYLCVRMIDIAGNMQTLADATVQPLGGN